MTITPNWLESPAKVELTRNDLLIIMQALREHQIAFKPAREDEYFKALRAAYEKLRAAFRGPKL